MCFLWLLMWKMEVLGVINEAMNYETHTFLEFWDFHSKSMDEAWDLHE